MCFPNLAWCSLSDGFKILSRAGLHEFPMPRIPFHKSGVGSILTKVLSSRAFLGSACKHAPFQHFIMQRKCSGFLCTYPVLLGSSAFSPLLHKLEFWFLPESGVKSVPTDPWLEGTQCNEGSLSRGGGTPGLSATSFCEDRNLVKAPPPLPGRLSTFPQHKERKGRDSNQQLSDVYAQI